MRVIVLEVLVINLENHTVTSGCTVDRHFKLLQSMGTEFLIQLNIGHISLEAADVYQTVEEVDRDVADLAIGTEKFKSFCV